jgi:hypothetical protein
MAKLFRPQQLFLISLALGWLFDFLFWSKMVGISLPIFTLLIIVAGLWWANRAGLKPSPRAMWLLIPIAFFSLVPAFRMEPFTRFTSMVMVTVLLAVFALSFLDGQWTRYGYLDYIAKILGLLPNGLGLLKQPASKAKKEKPAGFSWRSLMPVLRGLLFALPLLWFLAILLASADPAFADWLESVFSFIEIENLVEYLTRGFIILMVAYALAAAYMFAFNKSRKQDLIGEEKPITPPVLGFVEAITMLAAVNVLFLSFVVFQFNYFFGGITNVVNTETGFTYSQYAVRGFWELVVVSLISLGFFVILSTVSKKESVIQQRWFSGSGIALFALVAVILASAFERLLLYERVYGFTRMRTYPHVFMIWLGLLLLAIVILEALGKQRAFALATLVAVAGFSATLPVLNVDAFIADRNIELIYAGQQFERLDYVYLGTLSDDAVPSLVVSYQIASKNTQTLLVEQLATTLSCHFNVINDQQPASWQSWNLSRQSAAGLWRTITADPNFLEIQFTNSNSFTRDGVESSCYGFFWD